MPNPMNIEMETHLKENASEYDLIVLFGSYARGEAYGASDYDILIVDSRFEGWEVYESTEPVNFNWPGEFKDLHLVTSSHEEFQQGYEKGEGMIQTICNEGVGIQPPFGLVDYF